MNGECMLVIIGFSYRLLLEIEYLNLISKALTGTSFTNHVKLAAGRDGFDEQFPRMISPGLYLNLIPCITGRLSGTSAMTKG